MLGEHGARYVGTKVVVPADAPHRIEVGAREGTVIFLEPESAPGRAAHFRAVRCGWTVTPVLTFTRRRVLTVVVDELIAIWRPPAPTMTRRHGIPPSMTRCDCCPTWWRRDRSAAPNLLPWLAFRRAG